MTGAKLIVSFDDRTLSAALTGVRDAIVNPRHLLRAIGVGMAHNVRERMDRGADVWGRAWHPLSPAYAAIKRGPGILRESLQLQRSITFVTSGDTVAVGSNRKYARIHQFGGIIEHPGGTKFIRDAVTGKGKKARFVGIRFVKAGFAGSTEVTKGHNITMPARPYLGMGAEDRETIEDVTWALIRRKLG